MAQNGRKLSYIVLGALKSIAWTLGVVTLGSLLALWLDRHHIHGILALTDNIVPGIAAGVIVFFYERCHRREIQRKWQAVRLMNHHVRNDLQVIIDATSAEIPIECPGAAVENAVKHIEWALRELLPGELRMTSMVPALPNKHRLAIPLAERLARNRHRLGRC